ncbi:STAS domain-containing protein [Clostridium ganghwense]|uniref:STAS domain-containing protein n=1 Tax=Clostridium ganghwense TaxID=312089 RepID=A0ABT4CLJ9_9CLOT|nr:STAS domain-containing protein [Clostridium ganghwense]MCY6369921.1 STAS domain-containing protein [Clostridium ganghwense]
MKVVLGENTININVMGELTSKQIRTSIESIIEEIYNKNEQYSKLVLNLDSIKKIDVEGVLFIESLHKTAIEKHKDFKIIGVNNDMENFFEIIKLDNLLEHFQ